ncbi:MAG: PepSY domain-containing protein [Dehalococcoidales bacterium]|nr:PepSY domain-containing protein [Dehalococcoidales bacterium]
MRKIAIILLGLMMMVAGCNSWISECDAVKIAKEQLPASYADAGAITSLDENMGINGTWVVTFPNVDIPFNELGWEGDPDQYHKYKYDSSRGLPEGVFANVTIYIDAKTGEVTKRELDNRTFLGGPGIFSECN